MVVTISDLDNILAPLTSDDVFEIETPGAVSNKITVSNLRAWILQAALIRDALATLSGNNRLSASAIKDLYSAVVLDTITFSSATTPPTTGTGERKLFINSSNNNKLSLRSPSNGSTEEVLVIGNQSGNKILASPANGSSGAMSPRALVAADIPAIEIDAAEVTSGTFGTTRIANDAITYAKMQNISGGPKVLGKLTAGAGDIGELNLGAGFTIDGDTVNVSSSNSGGSSLYPLRVVPYETESISINAPSGVGQSLNGIIRYIGTNGNTISFVNPITSGKMAITFSAPSQVFGSNMPQTLFEDILDIEYSRVYNINPGNHVTIDFLAPVRVTILDIMAGIPNGNTSPIDFYVSVSNDLTNWTTVGTASSLGGYNNWRRFSLSTNNNFRYLRYGLTSNSSNGIQGSRLEFYGSVPSNPNEGSYTLQDSDFNKTLVANAALANQTHVLKIPTGLSSGDGSMSYVRNEAASPLTIRALNGVTLTGSPSIVYGKQNKILQKLGNNLYNLIDIFAPGITSTLLIASNTTAISNMRYLCNTNAGSFTLTLPASPSNGDVVGITDYYSTSSTTGFGTNALTIAANTGHNIVGSSTLVLDSGGQGVELVFHNNRWSIVSGIGEGGSSGGGSLVSLKELYISSNINSETSIFEVINTNQTINSSKKYLILSLTNNIEINVSALPIGGSIYAINQSNKKAVVFGTDVTSYRNVLGNATTIPSNKGMSVEPNSQAFLIRNSTNQFTYLQGSVAIAYIPSLQPAAISLAYTSNGDTNGLIYYLGTNTLTSSFVNPVSRGFLENSSNGGSIDVDRTPNKLTNRNVNGTTEVYHSVNSATAGVYIQIRLIGYTLSPDKYTLWSSQDHGFEYFPAWDFSGSNNGTDWTLIHQGSSSGGANTYYTSPTLSSSSFTYFRWTRTTSGGATYTVMGDVELYGLLELL